MITFRIRGVVREAETALPVANLSVKAYDEDLLFDEPEAEECLTLHHHRSHPGSIFSHRAVAPALALAFLLVGAGCGAPPELDALASALSADAAEAHPMANPIAPAAPMVEPVPLETPHCDTERCAGVEPVTPRGAFSLVRTGKHGRGTNTQLPIPQNLQLADIDADGLSDFVQFSSNKLFVSKTDFNKTGILHLYTGRPIKRVLTGDFSGGGSDQTCIITDDNALACYGISTDRHDLWWWFTQGSFLGDNEDAIVADFDNDGRDDVLVYPRAGGAYRMYSVKGSWFFNPTPSFNAGNIGTDTSGLQLRAGDFNADGRDDLMIVNAYRQILYYVSVWDGTYHTFWWAFTTVGGFVGTDDQVTVARIDNNGTDDIVLRNKVTGATRFHRMEYNGGSPPAITGVSAGQISTTGNSEIFWGYMHGSLTETGAYWRDDAMVYEKSWNGFVRSDARWDGTNLTYWWNYTQYAPNNHAGWAALTAKPWLLLKCKFSDISTTPQANSFYRDLMYSALVPYWRDVSYGSWDLSGSTVLDTWYTMSTTNAAWSQSTVSRWDRAGYCINAYGGSTAGYVNVISIVNGEGDAGNAGGRVLGTPNSSNSTFLAHETGHTFGWGHSFDDTTRKNAEWSAPGEYFDYWDIMSAMAVYYFSHPQGVLAGPEMNAPFRTSAAFIPAHRLTRLVPAPSYQTWRSNIAALNRPEANGPLMVRIGNNACFLPMSHPDGRPRSRGRPLSVMCWRARSEARGREEMLPLAVVFDRVHHSTGVDVAVGIQVAAARDVGAGHRDGLCRAKRREVRARGGAPVEGGLAVQPQGEAAHVVGRGGARGPHGHRLRPSVVHDEGQLEAFRGAAGVSHGAPRHHEARVIARARGPAGAGEPTHRSPVPRRPAPGILSLGRGSALPGAVEMFSPWHRHEGTSVALLCHRHVGATRAVRRGGVAALQSPGGTRMARSPSSQERDRGLGHRGGSDLPETRANDPRDRGSPDAVNPAN